MVPIDSDIPRKGSVRNTEELLGTSSSSAQRDCHLQYGPQATLENFVSPKGSIKDRDALCAKVSLRQGELKG